ncbi:MAG: 2Fe-2S iron-sulfur cluster binding domain-containing protein [Saprospiraceae bacterium]|nr:2Fe-2S iron-sulfur cluster binding domain-containing protein [Saprospiraceae bacterium]
MLEITVYLIDGSKQKITGKAGQTLRQVLLENDITPYTKMTTQLNCGGRGVCATCGVWIISGQAKSTHWHDRLADKYSYPRLSCQINLEEDLTVRLPHKWIWGSREAHQMKRAKKNE